MLNRYQAKESACNFLLKSEEFFAQYVGMKYALALNSGGIAISLGLEAMKRVLFKEDDFDQIRVYSNAFTFNAVPSACVVAGFRNTLKLIEATPELTIDLDHLETCIKEDLESKRFAPGKMILVLSYMRGRVPDMHRVMELCKTYEARNWMFCEQTMYESKNPWLQNAPKSLVKRRHQYMGGWLSRPWSPSRRLVGKSFKYRYVSLKRIASRSLS